LTYSDLTTLFSKRSRPQTFRYLEWIYIAIHFGMQLSRPGLSLPHLLGFYGVFFGLGWVSPDPRSLVQRILYIVVGLGTAIAARCFGVDLGLFIFFYFAKCYFLLNRRTAIALCLLTIIPWTVSEYFAESGQTGSLQAGILGQLAMILGTLATYTAASIFLFMFCAMMFAEEKSRYRIAELSEQVESLAASLERTRIAREIHDSLGHTLTDLDTQLAVAQTLRSHDPAQSFQAVDTAKLLARQCIEDVSQALDRMRQSDFNLSQALIGLAEQLRQSSDIQVKWQINLPQLSVYKSYQIYCIAKEALMNVQKHANASQVIFNSSLVAEGILLELKDNGIGFDPNRLATGFGLQGMVERAQLLGGKLDIETAVAQGTQIHVLLPL
jgi:signal transduction histidine kinase